MGKLFLTITIQFGFSIDEKLNIIINRETNDNLVILFFSKQKLAPRLLI